MAASWLARGVAASLEFVRRVLMAVLMVVVVMVVVVVVVVVEGLSRGARRVQVELVRRVVTLFFLVQRVFERRLLCRAREARGGPMKSATGMGNGRVLTGCRNDRHLEFAACVPIWRGARRRIASTAASAGARVRPVVPRAVVAPLASALLGHETLMLHPKTQPKVPLDLTRYLPLSATFAAPLLVASTGRRKQLLLSTP